MSTKPASVKETKTRRGRHPIGDTAQVDENGMRKKNFALEVSADDELEELAKRTDRSWSSTVRMILKKALEDKVFLNEALSHKIV